MDVVAITMPPAGTRRGSGRGGPSRRWNDRRRRWRCGGRRRQSRRRRWSRRWWRRRRGRRLHRPGCRRRPARGPRASWCRGSRCGGGHDRARRRRGELRDRSQPAVLASEGRTACVPAVPRVRRLLPSRSRFEAGRGSCSLLDHKRREPEGFDLRELRAIRQPLLESRPPEIARRHPGADEDRDLQPGAVPTHGGSIPTRPDGGSRDVHRVRDAEPVLTVALRRVERGVGPSEKRIRRLALHRLGDPEAGGQSDLGTARELDPRR
jgi:hypothetical protein